MRKLKLLILFILLPAMLPAPTFNLTSTQLQILTTWLYESNGYLDFACRISDSKCGRQAWEEDNAIDFVQWVRDNPQTDPGSSEEAKMVWWIRDNDQVNITPPQKPPEAATWSVTLQEWDSSIDAGFARAPQNERNVNSVNTFNENSCPIGWKIGDEAALCIVTGSILAGAHLSQQQQIITKVMGVL